MEERSSPLWCFWVLSPAPHNASHETSTARRSLCFLLPSVLLPPPPPPPISLNPQAHQGTADHGHYYSLIRTDGDRWLEFNDRRVTAYDPSNIPRDCFGGAVTPEVICIALLCSVVRCGAVMSFAVSLCSYTRSIVRCRVSW